MAGMRVATFVCDWTVPSRGGRDRDKFLVDETAAISSDI